MEKYHQRELGLAEGASPPQRSESQFESPLREVPTFSVRSCLEQNVLRWKIAVRNKKKLWKNIRPLCSKPHHNISVVNDWLK